MPVGTETKNGRQETGKTNGEEESSNSEDESSFYDEDDTERRKGDCIEDIQFLEQQFTDLKEMLYQEKVQDLEHKIQVVTEGNAPEYTQPLRELDTSLKARMRVAELQHKSRMDNIQHKYHEEVSSTQQDFEELCRVTKERMIAEIQDKMRKIKEDVVISRLNCESTSRKRRPKAVKFQLPDKRKKPVVVNGPCMVYMLRDIDIMEDTNDIRKGRAFMEVGGLKDKPTRKTKSPVLR
ncbi:breast cancer metastasis-suppressor 1-like protein [Halichondria panicea]|uniref:breast cancer metastasis-suppressor 1-like protein n=1 Tax=Halichondria panicea TaxID=6063 RepID=UPI00312B739D